MCMFVSQMCSPWAVVIGQEGLFSVGLGYATPSVEMCGERLPGSPHCRTMTFLSRLLFLLLSL